MRANWAQPRRPDKHDGPREYLQPMHEPVEVTVLEQQKIWGLLPRELAHLGAQVSWLMAIGFLLAGLTSHVWWFLLGTVLGGLNAMALDSLASYLRRLGYANSDLAQPDGEAPGAG
jgi:hypothetical protein